MLYVALYNFLPAYLAWMWRATVKWDGGSEATKVQEIIPRKIIGYIVPSDQLFVLQLPQGPRWKSSQTLAYKPTLLVVLGLQVDSSGFLQYQS